METTFESRHTSFVSLFPAELKIISNRSHSLGIDTPRITNIKHLFPYFIFPSFLPFFLFLFFEFSISKLFHKISTRDTSTTEKYYHENKYISRAYRPFRLERIGSISRGGFVFSWRHASRLTHESCTRPCPSSAT